MEKPTLVVASGNAHKIKEISCVNLKSHFNKQNNAIIQSVDNNFLIL